MKITCVKTLSIGLLVFIWSAIAFSQELNNEEIWYRGSFSQEGVAGFNFLQDGIHYTALEEGNIVQRNFLNPKKKSKVLFNSENWSKVIDGAISAYDFSEDEQYIILYSDKEPIYRRSFKAKTYLFNRKEETLVPINGDKRIQIVQFSPDSKKLAYMDQNDLYIYDLSTAKTMQVTSDGKTNHIINGHADWVYEEEFSITRMYEWSENGRFLAFIRFDESQVPEFYMRYYNGNLYPDDYHFKYPKVGENNAEVKVMIYDTKEGTTKEINQGGFQHYIPKIKWVPKSAKLCVTDINRHQNNLRLVVCDAENDKTSVILEEKSPYYLDIHDDLSFSSDGGYFFWTSPQSGHQHIYQYNVEGQLLKQITSGPWSVTKFYGFDEEQNELFYQAAQKSPMQREIYRYDLSKGESSMISSRDGYHTADFNSTLDFFINNYSSLNTPSQYSIVGRDGKVLKDLSSNADISLLQDKHGVQDAKFITVPNDHGDDLNAYIIPPENMEAGKEYPMLMFVYGGPGSQQVLDRMPRYYWWFQLLSKKGYYIACVDGRGTGARGEEFQKNTYLQLGKYETEDQIAAAKYFGNWESVNKDRIGIFGWSYGGYLSTLSILKGSDTFKAAVAVAPVTNWKWYDTVYTERFMRTEKENPDGYADNSPVNFAHLLEGDYLIVHGTGDDNVHPQHSYEMVESLIDHNKRFDMAFYPNKNHGIFGSFTRWHLFDHITSFIEEKL